MDNKEDVLTDSATLRNILEIAKNDKVVQPKVEKTNANEIDKCIHLREFLKLQENEKLENYIEMIEKNQKKFKIKIHVKKLTKISLKKLYQWSIKKFYIMDKNLYRFKECLVRDCFLLKLEEKKEKYQILSAEERRQYKIKNENNKNIQNKLIHEISLNRLYVLQQENYPKISIPYIIYYLVEKFKEFGGKETEGVFKTPIDGMIKKKFYQEIMKTGTLDIKDKNPHICAILLKEIFFKVDPILSCNFFTECMNAKTETEYQRIWKKLPHINKQVILYITGFLREMSDNKVVLKTKMSSDALCSILAPCFVRDLEVGKKTSNFSFLTGFFSYFTEWAWKTHSDSLVSELIIQEQKGKEDESVQIGKEEIKVETVVKEIKELETHKEENETKKPYQPPPGSGISMINLLESEINSLKNLYNESGSIETVPNSESVTITKKDDGECLEETKNSEFIRNQSLIIPVVNEEFVFEKVDSVENISPRKKLTDPNSNTSDNSILGKKDRRKELNKMGVMDEREFMLNFQNELENLDLELDSDPSLQLTEKVKSNDSSPRNVQGNNSPRKIQGDDNKNVKPLSPKGDIIETNENVSPRKNQGDTSPRKIEGEIFVGKNDEPISPIGNVIETNSSGNVSPRKTQGNNSPRNLVPLSPRKSPNEQNSNLSRLTEGATPNAVLEDKRKNRSKRKTAPPTRGHRTPGSNETKTVDVVSDPTSPRSLSPRGGVGFGPQFGPIKLGEINLKPVNKNRKGIIIVGSVPKKNLPAKNNQNEN